MRDSHFGQLGEHVNVRGGKRFFHLKPEELNCLPHCPAMNEFNPKMPLRNYRWDDCGEPAFRKEAMLAGISPDNEEEFLAEGKKLFADKHADG